MKKSVAMKWAKALRSGKYKQEKERLQTGSSYCCLGVLCVLAGEAGVDVEKDAGGGIYGHSLISQGSVGKWAGIKSPEAKLYAGDLISLDESRTLAAANDVDNLSFDEIADIIENEWENIT